MKRKARSPRRPLFPLVRTVLMGVPVVAVPVLSQDAAVPAAEPERMERTVVTGTNIESATAADSLKVDVLTMSDPINIGQPTVADTLRVRSTYYAGGTGVVNPGFGNGGDGSAQVSLRGLPSNATLLLVNGRRTATSDLNLIPEAAIDRIEILLDGAGAIYGSDAVAGVANVILKDEYQGAKFNGYYANTTDTDISYRKFSALVGSSTDKASVLASIEYLKSNEQLSVDRERSRPLSFQTSSTSNPGTFSNDGALPTDAEGRPTQVPLRWSLVPQNTTGLMDISQVPAGFNPTATVSVPAGANANATRNAEEARLNALLPANSPVRYGNTPALLPGFNEGFPYGVYTYGYRPQEKYAAYLSGKYDLFDENLSFFMDAYYVNNKSVNALAPSPLSGVRVPANNYWVQQLFPGTTAPIRSSYRPVELGPRLTENEFEDARMVAGLKGRIAQSSWKWESAFTYDRMELDSLQTGGVLRDTYVDLLGRTTPDAWNPFGYTPIGGSATVNTADQIASLYGEAGTKDTITLTSWDFKVGGDVFKLPGGYLQASGGTEYRVEKEDYKPDFAIQNGAVFPFNISAPLQADRDIWAGFGEVLIPIFGEDFTLPAFSAFSFSTAVRYEDYSDVGDTDFKPRYSFRWQPIDEQFTLRGSYAEGFIAPSFGDLYQLPGQDFTELYNPYTGLREQPGEAVLTIGNETLKPITTESWMIGGVFEPNFLDDFSVNANYYRIEQNGIPFSSAQYIVNEWYNYNPANSRDPSNPYAANAAPSAQNPLGAQVELNSLGEINQIRNVGPINSGARVTDGIDFGLSKGFNTDLGKFTVSGQATRILSFEQENFPGAGSIDYLGRYWGPGAVLDDTSFPEWRANVLLSYAQKRFTAAFGWNYVSGYEEDPTQQDFVGADSYTREVGEYFTFDLRVGYRVPWAEADLMFGVNNLLDEQPQLVESSFENAYDRRVGDIRGRMFFVSLTKEF
jgi:iron complex outermembrane receptor protein